MQCKRRGEEEDEVDVDIVTKEDVDTLKNDWLTDNVSPSFFSVSYVPFFLC